MRESKSASQASAAPSQPLPAKKQKQAAAPQKEVVVAAASDSTVDVLSAKIKSQEDTIAKRDEEIQQLHARIADFEATQVRLQKLFEEKYQDLSLQSAAIGQEIRKRDEELLLQKMHSKNLLADQEREHQRRVQVLEAECAHVMEEKNALLDKILKIEEVIDAKDERIAQLEKEYQRKADEAELRREVIDSMSQSLMAQESVQRDLATKMVMMKNQILENDAGKSIGRKFGAIKIGLMNVNTPVAVSTLWPEA